MNNKIYLITGASGGIGSAIAKVVASNIDSGTIILHYNHNFQSVEQLKSDIERGGGQY